LELKNRMQLPTKLAQTVATEIKLLSRRDELVSSTMAKAAPSGRNKISQGKVLIMFRN
jgi:hypothetical protein